MGFADLATKALNLVSGGVVDRALGMVDKLIPDKNLATQLKAQLETLRETQGHEETMAALALLSAQTDVNKAEASSPSIFVAGARPFILWTCGVAIAWQYVLQPFVIWGAFLAGINVEHAPQLNTAELMGLTTSMLGLAAYRTYEKRRGVARDNLR